MTNTFLRFGAALALAASASMIASPALARDRWHHGRHHGDGIDGGDVLAGVLILGGIAAIASAASKSDRDREYREPYPAPYPDERPEYRPEYAPRAPSPDYVGGGIDNAVDMCVGQVELGSENVASVDNAARTGDGWRISGQLGSGGGFSCWIDNDGRIRNVDLDTGDYQGASYDAPADGQWDDADYSAARERLSIPEGDAAVDGDLATADY
jgi:hypothetical protein